MKQRRVFSFMFSRVTRNIVFWLLFTLYHYSSRGNVPLFYVVLFFVLTISYGIPCYIHNLWLIPRFLLRRKYWQYISLFIVLLVLTCVESFYITHFANDTFPGLNYMGDSQNVSMAKHAFPSLLMFAMLAFGKFMADAINNNRKMEDLERQKLQSELENLKSQINPHFLFNSLNTIYGMARRTDYETADAVIKLSDILRYVLYDCDVDKISLEQEFKFVMQYIEFTRLRMHNRGDINLEINSSVNGHSIAPLLLMPFVENAIKHGLGKHSKNSKVDVRMELKEDTLHFLCSNSNYNKAKTNGAGGIGLKNVKRRLELLYPDKYQLNIQDNNEYIVDLKLKLT